MVYNVPIESLEERYSAQWNIWFPNEFQKKKTQYKTLYGETLVDEIRDGSFLDVCGTNHFKASQLMQLTELLFIGEIKAGDVVFFHNLWFPGLEMLQYIRQGINIDFKLCGILHAGTYDPHDFLAKKGMSYWGKKLEEAWFSFVDKIFVATHFHKKLLLENRIVSPEKIVVTGLPIYSSEFWDSKSIKENIVVFPHRLDGEKNPHLFDLLKEELQYTGWEFVKTKDVCKTKEEYYSLLNKAKVAVSFADQETWGIAQQEALFCGCIPVVPQRLSYIEMYDPMFQYSSFKEAVRLVENMIAHSDYGKKQFIDNRNELMKRGRTAISRMIEEVEKLNEKK